MKTATLTITTTTGTTRLVSLNGTGTCAPITVTGSLPTGNLGMLYGGVLTATGADSAYAFTVANGTLPAGLSLGSNGVDRSMARFSCSCLRLIGCFRAPE